MVSSFIIVLHFLGIICEQVKAVTLTLLHNFRFVIAWLKPAEAHVCSACDRKPLTEKILYLLGELKVSLKRYY